MKRCKYQEDIVEEYMRQVGEDMYGGAIGEIDYQLVDVLCHLDKDNPKHHNDYDCKTCKAFKEEL
jgi:hypothetical protein